MPSKTMSSLCKTDTHLKYQSCRALWGADELKAKSMFQEREKLKIMGGLLWENSPGGFLPLAYVLFHVLHLALKNLMNELEATSHLSDNSKHHPTMEVLLENKDDLTPFADQCIKPSYLWACSAWDSHSSWTVLWGSACSAFAAPSGTPSHGWVANGHSMV